MEKGWARRGLFAARAHGLCQLLQQSHDLRFEVSATQRGRTAYHGDTQRTQGLPQRLQAEQPAVFM